MSTMLYMFAFEPPPDLAAGIHLIRVAFSKKYHAYEALKPPVHITMYDPIEISFQESAAFENGIAKLQKWADQYKPVNIKLLNYNFFHDASGRSGMKPVVYIDVDGGPGLKELHKELLIELRRYKWLEKRHKTFKPHITIAYRDTNPRFFPQMKEDYSNQSFEASFICNELHLWRHTGNSWQTIQTFQFNDKPAQLSLFN
jgi:2'-5' RNA ligase